MDKKIIKAAAFMGAVAIILGAFGAHSLKSVLDETQLATFETGVRYQMYHALFLLFVGTTSCISIKTKQIVFWLVVIGVVLFSGSIYLLSTASLTSINAKIIGPVTPLGGLLMISAWVVLFSKISGEKAE
ncbi:MULTISPECIES: DUF423 domain-containing protein [Flavobacterium]|uniref:DUF423 domain-containing protein n=1 Tax=Flavobacterium TaxID=237 RepID=UPI001FCA6227|nr:MULTISPECIES: DUF423 domain-containing protein [Flavobacterium]UOK43433.1 DUF423 domain-containing protein [Flavobacterium enshiense]